MRSLESALARTLLWMTAGAAAAVPILFVPQPDDPLLTVTIHLSLLVVFAIALTFHLAPLAADGWFRGLAATPAVRAGITWAVVVVAVTGATGLVTLATSAAFRYDASLQFLQLLSSLDIAWAAATLVIAVRILRSGPAALAAGGVLGIVCVWAIWRYLDIVGFGPSGEWIVSASDLMELVLPYDMGAAAIAVVTFFVAMRRVSG